MERGPKEVERPFLRSDNADHGRPIVEILRHAEVGAGVGPDRDVVVAALRHVHMVEQRSGDVTLTLQRLRRTVFLSFEQIAHPEDVSGEQESATAVQYLRERVQDSDDGGVLPEQKQHDEGRKE